MDKLQVKELLHGQNFRLTKEREQLLDLFSQSISMLTPGELYELARQNHVRVGLTTVYRLLEVLTNVGVATPFLVDGAIYYSFCSKEHHHHFVCLSCHRVVDIHGECPAFKMPPKFEVQSHRADLFGVCPNCKNDEEMGSLK